MDKIEQMKGSKKKVCFVSHSSSYDFENELYQPLRKVSEGMGYNFLLPHENQGEVVNSKVMIERAEVVLAEVSNASTGQGIELGWAQDRNKKIVCVYKKGSSVSRSLQFVCGEMLEYQGGEELARIVGDLLTTNSVEVHDK